MEEQVIGWAFASNNESQNPFPIIIQIGKDNPHPPRIGKRND